MTKNPNYKKDTLWHSFIKLLSRKVTDEDAETILWSTAENQTVHAHAAGCSHEGDECGTMLHIDRLGDVKLSQMLPNGNGTNPAGFHLTRGPDRLILRVPHDTEWHVPAVMRICGTPHQCLISRLHSAIKVIERCHPTDVDMCIFDDATQNGGEPGDTTLWHTDTSATVLAQRAKAQAARDKTLAAERSAKRTRDLAKDTNSCPGSNLFFVHVPKNGGGTVEQSICPMKYRYSTKAR